MRKLIFIALLLFTGLIQAQGINLKDQDSIAYNEFIASDIFGVQKYVTGSWDWHRTSWYGLSFGIRNFLQGQANTWTATNTFNGTVQSSTLGTIRSNFFYNVTSGAGTVGASNNPFWRMYARLFVVVNNGATDSVVISMTDDDKLEFSKPIVYSDSSAADLGSVEKPFKTIHTDSIKANYNLVLMGGNGGEYGSVEIEGLLMLNRYYTSSVTDTFLTMPSNVIEINESVVRDIYKIEFSGNITQNSKTMEITILVLNADITFKAGGATKNSFRLPNDADIIVSRYGTIRFIYAPTIERWLKL